MQRSNTVKGIMPGMMEIGKIKTGIKGEMITSAKGNQFRPPVSLDHFIITTNQRDDNGDYLIDETLTEALMASPDAIIREECTAGLKLGQFIEALMPPHDAIIREDKEEEKHNNDHISSDAVKAQCEQRSIHKKGGKLIGIPIRLLYNDIALNFPTRLVCNVGGKLVCTGDGETATSAVRGEIPCPCERYDPKYTGNDKCKMNGVLSCIVDGSPFFGGCYKYRTASGSNTCPSIIGGLSAIKLATGGILAFLPLHLVMQPKTTTIPTTGQTTTIQVVSVMYRGSPQELQKEALEMVKGKTEYLANMKQIENSAKQVAFFDDDNAEMAMEFYPDSITEDAEDIKEEAMKEAHRKEHAAEIQKAEDKTDVYAKADAEEEDIIEKGDKIEEDEASEIAKDYAKEPSVENIQESAFVKLKSPGFEKFVYGHREQIEDSTDYPVLKALFEKWDRLFPDTKYPYENLALWKKYQEEKIPLSDTVEEEAIEMEEPSKTENHAPIPVKEEDDPHIPFGGKKNEIVKIFNDLIVQDRNVWIAVFDEHGLEIPTAEIDNCVKSKNWNDPKLWVSMIGKYGNLDKEIIENNLKTLSDSGGFALWYKALADQGVEKAGQLSKEGAEIFIALITDDIPF